MTRRIEAVGTAVTTSPVEVATLGRTLTRRRDDVLAFFNRTGSGNGPTEAINGRLERLRHRPRLPQPHPPHRPITARDRRVQTGSTPWIVKSPQPLVRATVLAH